MGKVLIAILLGVMVVLPACSPIPKPNLIVPNVQAGATNQQTVGKTQNTTITRPQARRDVVQSTDTNQVRAERVENVTVNQISWWMIALLFLFWQLPSPSQMGEAIGRTVGRFLPKGL